MSRSLNKVTLIGNVGGDPEIRSTATGTRVAKFSIATSRRFQDRDGQNQERTDWHRITAFGRVVDVIERWVNKGDRLYIEGRLEYSQTQDNQGATRYWTDIILDQMIMLGSGGGRDGGDHGGGGDYRRSDYRRGDYRRGDQTGKASGDRAQTTPSAEPGSSGERAQAASSAEPGSMDQPDDDLPF